MNNFRKLLSVLVLAIIAFAFSSCRKDSIEVVNNNLWFEADGGTQTLEIVANCSWNISKDGDADWFTITPTSSQDGQGVLTITVEPLTIEDEGYRRSSFTILSPKGGAQVVIFISQGQVEFKSIYNLVFGLKKEQQWKTDFYGVMIDDEYQCWEFDPFDTTTGFMMYFFENGTGVQVDCYRQDTAVYYMFDYNYNIADRELEYWFEKVDGSIEHYNTTIITATPELFRFEQEYEPHYWERSDMKKIGSIDPGEKASILTRAMKQRKESGPIFQF